MQVVKCGKKQREVKVPVGWKFLKDGQEIKYVDKFFNATTHAWEEVDPSNIGSVVGEDMTIVIRSDKYSYSREIDTDSHAVRECE